MDNDLTPNKTICFVLLTWIAGFILIALIVSMIVGAESEVIITLSTALGAVITILGIIVRSSRRND